MNDAKIIKAFEGADIGNKSTLIRSKSNGHNAPVQDGADRGADMFRILPITARFSVDIAAINQPNPLIGQKDIIEVKIIMIKMVDESG